MNDILVTLDTNAYRNMCKVSDPTAEIQKYLNQFANHGIIAFANSFVLMELANHLAEKTDLAFDNCRKALCAQHRLCSAPGNLIRILVNSEAMVLKCLYNISDTEAEKTAQDLCSLSKHVLDTLGELHSEAILLCTKIKEHLQKIEQQFADDILQYVVKEMNPSSVGWNPLENNDQKRVAILKWLSAPTTPVILAKAHVIKAMARANVKESANHINDKADFIYDKFPVPILLYREILKRIVETGCDLTKRNRQNWIWDMEIALGVGQQITPFNKELHLITTDRDILQAAINAGCGSYVHSLEDFRASIGISNL